MSLDTKYRPNKFSDVVGQDDTVAVLQELLRRKEVFQKSYVFSGPSGTGKTTTARILARAMLCSNLDENSFEPCNECPSCKDILTRGASFAFTEMDAANNSGADNIRKIIEGLEYFTLDGGDRKIYLVDECHRLSTQAMDALLKPMEDNIPGTKDKRLVVLFCTTEPEKLRGTIKSRCLVFNIKEPTREAMIQRLRYIADEENIAIDDDSLDVIFSYGKGHIRDMVNGLERVSRVLPKKDEGVLPETGTIVRQQLGLGVVEKEYQILLNLKDDIDASMLSLSDALTQADANNVYSGIADAALAAFRHQKGITIGLGYIEKSLCSELGKVYSEEELLNIAHHIMNTSRKVDRNALVCELLVLQDKIRKGILGHTSGVVTVERIVEKSVESMSSTSPPNKSVPQPRGSVPKVKTKLGDYAQIDMAHGASAARGVPVKPSNIVEDPAVTHVKSKVPVQSAPAVGSLVPIINRKPMVPDDD